jgi:hypothetical protein
VVVQRHLEPLVGVLVVHVVDHVHRVDVDAGQPVHHPLEAGHDVAEVEDVALDRPELGRHLLPRDLIASAVDRVEQALGEVGPRPEELHLLAHEHWRHAAGDRPVVPPRPAHDLVALELDGARVDSDLRREAPESVGQPRRVPDGQVGLGSGAEVVEGL